MPAETEPQARVWMDFPTCNSYVAEDEPMHPGCAITRESLEVVRDTRDVIGRGWEIIEVYAPRIVRDSFYWVDYSYINHVVVNGGVIGCDFDDPNDLQAKEILEAAYPGREVVMVPARQGRLCRRRRRHPLHHPAGTGHERTGAVR